MFLPHREKISALPYFLIIAIIQGDDEIMCAGKLGCLNYLLVAGIKTAVVSASKNAVPVLEAAEIFDLFDLVVDGKVAARLGLAGKPAPDPFLEAARELNVPPERAIVIEDAISGVKAGRAGKFGLVIGVDREGLGDALREHGAHIVVTGVRELEFKGLKGG